MTDRRAGVVILILTVALAALAIGAITIGPYPLSPGVIVQGLFGGKIDETQAVVLFDIRLPRVMAAILVGAALAAAGAAFQSLFRNPLVSPDILGVSAGAGLGAVAGIFLSLPVIGIQVFAFVGGLGAVALVYVVAAGARGRDPILVLVLAGVVVGALAGAGVSLLKVLADPYDQLPAITFWLLGALAHVQSSDLLSTIPAVALGLVTLTLLRWRIDVLSLGDEEARALGVSAGRLRAIVVAAATLMTAAVVSISGVIGWVGLVIPHLARMIVGPALARLLPAATLLGAAYLLAVDTLARTVAEIEIPLGVLTAVVGAPVFIWLLAKGRRVWT